MVLKFLTIQGKIALGAGRSNARLYLRRYQSNMNMIHQIIRKLKMFPIDSDDWGLGIITILISVYLLFYPEEFNLQYKIILGVLVLYVILSITLKFKYRKLGLVDSYSHKLGYPHKFWPNLPIEGFITGSPALESDVRVGDAVFYLENSENLNIELPQYGLLSNTEIEVPLVVIQGERSGNEDLLGFVNLHSGELQYELSSNIQLLGSVKPTTWLSSKVENKLLSEPRGFIQVSIFFTLLFGIFIALIMGLVSITGIIQHKLMVLVLCFSLFAFSWYITSKVWPYIKMKLF